MDSTPFSRHIDKLLVQMRIFMQEGKHFTHRGESYQEPYLDSGGDFSDIVISVIATVAKMEREKISERTKAGLARAKAKGVQLGRRSKITDNQILKVWEEYDKERSMSRTAKVVPWSKGTVYFIISNNIRNREQYLTVKKRVRKKIPGFTPA